MVTSGAMCLGNILPAACFDWVVWTPLFHAVDPARGLAFETYVPRHSLPWPAQIFAGLALLSGTTACHSGSRATFRPSRAL